MGEAEKRMIEEALKIFAGDKQKTMEALRIGKTNFYEELEMAVKLNVGRIIVGNFYELKILEGISKEYDRKISILFRITPEVEGKTHSYITTGQKDSKFGIPLETEINESAVIRAINSSYINLKGFLALKFLYR